MATITEYYKEKLKEALNSDNTDYEVVRWIEQNFPELKESEDERIRKTLIHIVKGACNKYGIKYQGTEIGEEKLLAWLEKQGKSNMGISEATKQKLEDNLNKALQKETPESWNEFLEKQGEQKPAEWHREDEQNLNACLGYIPDEFLRRWLTDAIHVKYDKPADKVEPKFKVGDIITPKDGGHKPWQIMQVDILDKKYRLKKGYVIHFSQEDDYELVEQKPAWSEEDESHVKSILSTIECCKAQFPNAQAVVEAYNADTKWLKSLKDRVQPQQQERSERDKEKSHTAIDTLAKAAQQDYVHWLKYIKRYTWKPSDEQMKCLSAAIEESNENSVLESLLSDLKKLKGK